MFFNKGIKANPIDNLSENRYEVITDKMIIERIIDMEGAKNNLSEEKYQLLLSAYNDYIHDESENSINTNYPLFILRAFTIANRLQRKIWIPAKKIINTKSPLYNVYDALTEEYDKEADVELAQFVFLIDEIHRNNSLDEETTRVYSYAYMLFVALYGLLVSSSTFFNKSEIERYFGDFISDELCDRLKYRFEFAKPKCEEDNEIIPRALREFADSIDFEKTEIIGDAIDEYIGTFCYLTNISFDKYYNRFIEIVNLWDKGVLRMFSA